MLSAVLATDAVASFWGFSLEPASFSGVLFVLVPLAVMARAFYLRRSLLDSPVYLALYAYALFIGIGPLLSGMIPDKTVLARGSIELTGRAILILWSGMAALIFGYTSVRRETGPRNDGTASTADNRTDEDTVLMRGGIFLTVIGVGGIIAFLIARGGLGFLLETAYGTREYPASYVATASMLRPGLFLIAAWALARQKRALLVWVSLFVYTCFDLLWFGPVSGSRSQIITLVLTLIYLARFVQARGFVPVKGLKGRWLIIIGVILTLVWGGLRNRSIEELASSGPTELNVVANSQLVAAETFYAPYQGFLGILDLVPSKMPFGHGQTLLDSLTIFVPRFVWTSKPESFGVWFAQTLYDSSVIGNTVPTWPGELYFNFGWFGLTLGMYATGIVCALIARLRPKQRTKRCSIYRCLMAALWFPLPFVWIWGGSNTAVWHVLVNVVPVWAVYRGYAVFQPGSWGAVSRFTSGDRHRFASS